MEQKLGKLRGFFYDVKELRDSDVAFLTDFFYKDARDGTNCLYVWGSPELNSYTLLMAEAAALQVRWLYVLQRRTDAGQ